MRTLCRHAWRRSKCMYATCNIGVCMYTMNARHVNYHLKSEVSITLCCQLCSTRYTAIQIRAGTNIRMFDQFEASSTFEVMQNYSNMYVMYYDVIHNMQYYMY